MDVAALGMKVDSSDVVKATTDLDKFAASADRAAGSAGKLAGGGGTARLAAEYARAAQSAGQAAGNIQRLQAASNQAASAQQSAAAVAARAGGAYQQADAQVIAYRNHLLGLVTASQQVAAGQAGLSGQVGRVGTTALQANAHVLAYQANLQRLAASSTAAGAASARAAGGIAAVGIAARASGALAGAFASILGGLIGVIIGTVITALIEMTSKLWDSDAAMKEVTVASDNLGAAQNVLGEMFDLSTGKIKNNTEAIRGNIYMQMIAMQQKAVVSKQEADAALSDAGSGPTSWGGRLWTRAKGYASGPMGGAVAEAAITAQDAEGARIQRLSMGVASGMPLSMAGAQLDRQKMGDEKYFATMNAFNKSYESFTANRAAGLMEGVFAGGGLPDEFLKPDKAKTPRKGGGGGKTDAEKLADIVRNAEAEITAERNRSKAVELSAQAASELEQKTKLLNAASSAGLKLTPALTSEIDKLAAAYATAKVDADFAEIVQKSTDEIQRQRDEITEQTKLVGLYGDALARARREMEAEQKLREALPKGEIYVGGNLTGGLSDDIESADRAARIEKIRRERELSAYALDLEARALGLTGEAALEYAFISERLLEAKRAGIELSPAEISAINAAGAAYADQRYAIDQTAQAMADSREITKGFFSDWTNGIRESGNLFKSFADTAINSLNRIIDKLLDKTLSGFFDSMFAGGGGGFLSSIFGARSSLPGTAGGMDMRGFAQGGAFGTAERFAKGAAFTNQIVNNPTLFKFANGSKFGLMGEAGPEAVMPLTRGPNGKLGVQAHGAGRGAPPSVAVSIQQDFHLSGTVSQKDVESMSRQAAQQGAEAAVNTVRRNFDTYLREWDNDGAVTS